jgi:Lipase (class 3)
MTAEFWQYDSRLGRRWNVDPVPDISISSYATFFNNPIWNIDKLGDRPTAKQAAQMANDSYNKFSEQRKISGRWKRLEKFGEVAFSDQSTGFESALYSRTINGKTEFVFATAGTTAQWGDIVADVSQPLGMSKQYEFSVNQAKKLNKDLANVELTFVGHSLGGGEAALNALKFNREAITFNAAGVGKLTKFIYGVVDKSEEKIAAFRVAGEVVGTLQGKVGSKANGNIYSISATEGELTVARAAEIDKKTGFLASAKLHMMTSVFEALKKAGYGSAGNENLVFPYVPIPRPRLPQDADNTISRHGPVYYRPSLPQNQ